MSTEPSSAGEPAYDVFLAYPSPSRPHARAIFDALSEAGYRVFMDVASLRPGDQWNVEIPRAQRHSRCTLVLLSKSTDAAFYQGAEVVEAIRLMRNSVHRVIPVYLEGQEALGESVPYGLPPLQGIDLGSGRGPSELVTELARVLPPPKSHEFPHPPEPGWHWWGTRGSADRGTISVLALVETLVASSIYAFIALRYGTLHLTLSACLAPLLLLRTPESQRLGLTYAGHPLKWLRAWLDRLTGMLDKKKPVRGLLLVTFLLSGQLWLPVLLAAIAVAARMSATAIAVLRAPGMSIKAIPVNWWRQVACVDTTHDPEPLPGLVAAIKTPEFETLEVLHPARVFNDFIRGRPPNNEKVHLDLKILLAIL